MSTFFERSRRVARTAAGGPRLRTYVVLAVAALVAVGTLGVTFGANAGGSDQANSPVGLSLNAVSGSPNLGDVSLLPADVRALQRFEKGGESLHELSLLGTRGGRSYYRIENSTGSACYGVGPVNATEYRLGQILCVPDFPSANRPLLDFTIVHGGSAASQDRVWRSEGIAADGIRSIAFETPSGRTVAVTPVIDNVYSVTSVPSERVAKLVARDANGEVIYSAPASR
jgi:hypothetical protein